MDDPARFDRELRRVGENILYVVPPLWDITGTLNFSAHKWIFLTLKKEHNRLPRYTRLPFSRKIYEQFAQPISA